MPRDLTGNRSVAVVPHPPDLPVIRGPLPEGPLRLLALGYLRDYKGTDLAIHAVARMAASGDDVSLTVAGEPWDRKPGTWLDLVHRLHLEDRVTLRLEYQSDQDVVDLLASHHALIAPYRSATQSGVVAQALAAGRPVVATNVGGIPDLVSDGKNGTLAQPDDVESLVDAIDRLRSDLPALAARASSNQVLMA